MFGCYQECWENEAGNNECSLSSTCWIACSLALQLGPGNSRMRQRRGEMCIINECCCFAVCQRLDVNKNCIESKEGIIIHFNIWNDMQNIKNLSIDHDGCIVEHFMWTLQIRDAPLFCDIWAGKLQGHVCDVISLSSFPTYPVTLLTDYYTHYEWKKQLEILFWNKKYQFGFWGFW